MVELRERLLEETERIIPEDVPEWLD